MANPVEERLEGDYLFKFQFFIHECQLLKDFFNISKPAIAIRFLDFPTLIIDGEVQSNGLLKFCSGKKSNFKMNSEDLREALLKKPFFVMFVDAQPNNNVSLAVYANRSEFFEQEKQNLNLRRNFLYLFDNMKNEIMKMDATIGISLLERNEQEKLQAKLERIHPIIPNAKIGDKDKAALHLQQFSNNVLKPDPKIQVHFQENDDPNVIIAENRRQSKQEQVRINQQPTKNNPILIQENSSSQSEDIKEESMIDEQDSKDKLIQMLDRENRYAINQEKKQNSIYKLLDEPFQPPPMFYEKKVKPLPEKALIMKHQAKLQKGTKAQQMQIVKEALSLQEQRFLEELEAKQKLIKQQQDMIARQHYLILEQQELEKKKQQEQLEKKNDKDYIQLNDIEKLRGLEPTDRYNVLEFLIKELIQLKTQDTSHDRKHKKRRRQYSSSSYDSEVEQSHKSKGRHSKKPSKQQTQTQTKSPTNNKTPVTIKVQDTEQNEEEEGKLESISVDDHDQLVQSSRKEWEEELTSTQQLGISMSGKKIDSSTKNPQRKQYVEQTIKLQNFVASDAKVPQNNKFNSLANQGSTHNRKISEMSENEDDYEEDFESFSRSQVGNSMGKLSVKKSLKPNHNEEESYSQEFESMAESKTLSHEATVICFMCKQQIPKSQALSHNKICTKVQPSSKLKAKVQDDNKNRKYSPIRETEDEEAHSVKNSARGASKKGSKHGMNSSSDNYSSYRYDESESSRAVKQVKPIVKKIGEERKSTDYMRESYMSSSLSASEKPHVANFSKQVSEFMKGGKDEDDDEDEDEDGDNDDDDDEEESSSLSKSAGDSKGPITKMYEKYKKLQEQLAKYNAGDLEESATISRSQ